MIGTLGLTKTTSPSSKQPSCPQPVTSCLFSDTAGEAKWGVMLGVSCWWVGVCYRGTGGWPGVNPSSHHYPPSALLCIRDMSKIVGPGYSSGEYIFGCSQHLALRLRRSAWIVEVLIFRDRQTKRHLPFIYGSAHFLWQEVPTYLKPCPDTKRESAHFSQHTDTFLSLTGVPNWPFRCLYVWGVQTNYLQ